MTTTEAEEVRMEESRLRGKVALVTGGGRGLGQAICEVLAKAGATVVAADVDPNAAQRVANELSSPVSRCDALELDVRDESSVNAAIEEIMSRHGHLDIVVNNAGTDVTAPFDALAVSDWDNVLAVNLRGPFLVAHAAFPLMRNRASGHIVNIISTAGKRAWANATAYHASKWGLLGFSHALHVEGRECGIKVTAVVSGGMRTPFLLDRFPDLDPALLQDPRTVAETVRFVLSQPDESVIPEIMVLPMRETSWP
jgi:NAD(P)-dependent dehydrogenase (short-subunit alcohol dehydrogenase family)